MGLTTAKVTIRRDRKAKEGAEVEFLVDSGAAFSVVPGTILAELGIEPVKDRRFTFANGDQIVRKMGEAYFEYAGQGATSQVIFGQPGDRRLLGVMTLESLELLLDPVNNELKPLPMLLM